MKCSVIVLVGAACLAMVNSYPIAGEAGLRSEALERLLMVEADKEAALRSKRTIGILRQLFPEITQMIDDKVNAIVAEVLRVLGPVVLRSVLGGGSGTNGGSGGAGGATKSNSGSTLMASSPFDDDDDDDKDDSGNGGGGSRFDSNSSNGSRVSISLPTFPPDEEEKTDSPTTMTATTTTTTVSTTSTGSVAAAVALETTTTDCATEFTTPPSS